jgi:hypothetical protein
LRPTANGRRSPALALGAIGTAPAIAQLEDPARGAGTRRVRTAARHALQEATYPTGPDPAVAEPLSASSLAAVTDRVDEGDWLWVEPRAFPVGTGTLRGRVESVETIVDSIEVTLHNPYEDYGVALTDTDENSRPLGEYADDRQSGTTAIECKRFGTVADDLVPLLYALPADHLSFTIEGRLPGRRHRRRSRPRAAPRPVSRRGAWRRHRVPAVYHPPPDGTVRTGARL